MGLVVQLLIIGWIKTPHFASSRSSIDDPFQVFTNQIWGYTDRGHFYIVLIQFPSGTDRQQRSLMRRDGLRDAAENAIEGVLPCGLEQIVRAGLDLMAIFVPKGLVSIIAPINSSRIDLLQTEDDLAGKPFIRLLRKLQDCLNGWSKHGNP